MAPWPAAKGMILKVEDGGGDIPATAPQRTSRKLVLAGCERAPSVGGRLDINSAPDLELVDYLAGLVNSETTEAVGRCHNSRQNCSIHLADNPRMRHSKTAGMRSPSERHALRTESPPQELACPGTRSDQRPIFG